jgi:transglutaminase-like putative cysteine protease
MRFPMRRRILGLSILAVWVVVVGMQVRRAYFRPEAARLELGARRLAPGWQFFAIRLNGRTIGVATSRLDTTATGPVFEDMMSLDVPALDTFSTALARTHIELNRGLELRSLRFLLQSSVGDFEVKGTMRPDSLLALEIRAGGEPQKSMLRLDPGVTTDAALPLRLAAGGQLRVGQELRAPLFDPSVLATREAVVRVTAESTFVVTDSAAYDRATRRYHAARSDTVRAWRIEERLGGVAVVSWVDGEGRIVRAESPLGFAIERTVYELARQDWQDARRDRGLAAGYGPLIESTAIAARVDVGRLAQTRQLRLRLTGAELEGFDLEGGRQSLRGDTLTIVQEAPGEMRAGYTLPWRAGGAPAAELESTPLIQAVDPEIVHRARHIARGSANPMIVAGRLNGWVYSALRKEITPSVPSATEVLRAGRGDCNEHTVLYVALARALGLPARTAAGLVYVRGHFYYHAWPEVWLSRWVAVDPTLGQFPADASHLRFVTGGLARQLDLVRLIGRLRLEVLP